MDQALAEIVRILEAFRRMAENLSEEERRDLRDELYQLALEKAGTGDACR